MVEAKRLLSNPEPRPAFQRLLHYLTEKPDFRRENSSLTWEKSVSNRKMQQQHRLKPEEIKELLYAYSAGELIENLAARFSIHSATVIAHVQRSGIRHRSSKS